MPRARLFLSTWGLRDGGGRKGLGEWGESEVVLPLKQWQQVKRDRGHKLGRGWMRCVYTCSCARLGLVAQLSGGLSCSSHSNLGDELVSELGTAVAGMFGDLTKVSQARRGRARM